MYVDNAAMRMIQEPKFFDVMVTENTFGDILTDEGSCISGSMGLLLPLLPERARRFSSRFMALGRRRKAEYCEPLGANSFSSDVIRVFRPQRRGSLDP